MESIVNQILAQQEEMNHRFLVDIRLFNGNILLRSFHITDMDPQKETIKGLTAQEEYCYAREGRAPEYCMLRFSDIKEINCPELELHYSAGILA